VFWREWGRDKWRGRRNEWERNYVEMRECDKKKQGKR
jgi:hypothetical protein